VAQKQGRALARRKLEASPDARHEWREGETVRDYAKTIKSKRVFGHIGFRPFGFSIRQKAFSGFCPYLLYRL